MGSNNNAHAHFYSPLSMWSGEYGSNAINCLSILSKILWKGPIFFLWCWPRKMSKKPGIFSSTDPAFFTTLLRMFGSWWGNQATKKEGLVGHFIIALTHAEQGTRLLSTLFRWNRRYTNAPKEAHGNIGSFAKGEGETPCGASHTGLLGSLEPSRACLFMEL